jgi:hypothetical protein
MYTKRRVWSGRCSIAQETVSPNRFNGQEKEPFEMIKSTVLWSYQKWTFPHFLPPLRTVR